jgi:hypothetical protein
MENEMGYTTDFEGQFDLDRPLDVETFTFLNKFNETRRMKRNLGPEFGVEGEFYVNGDDTGVIDYNDPPRTQPGLWCQWTPTEDGRHIEWDGGEKFYEYVEWIRYLIDAVLAPKDYVLNGTVEWQGEESDDRGRIVVKDNEVTIQSATIVWEDDK